MGAVALLAAGFVHYRWKTREQRYNRLIAQVADKYGVDKFLIKAVMRQESGFDPNARSRVGAMGLMQVMEATGIDWARAVGRRDFKADALWNEQVNIEAGAWCLARALRRWKDRDDALPFALAEYNAGAGNCLHWLPRGAATTAEEFKRAISYPSVVRYVEAVTEYYADYRASGEL